MTVGTGTGVLHRMTRRQQPDAPDDVPLTASRAVRLAVARGAQVSTGLVLTVGAVREQALSLDALLDECQGELLLIGLTRGGATVGLIACDAGLVSAAIEVMTTGHIGPAAPDTGRITRTAGTLVQPLLRHVLDELEVTTARTALDGWAQSVGLGNRFDSARAAGFALKDGTYRLIRMSLDCGAPDRQGDLLVALPLQVTAAPPPQDSATPEPARDWHSLFQAAVMQAPARLDAVLHRMEVPLSTVSTLEVGQCLPLLGCTVGMVRLVDPAGQTVARGRLGQIAGRIAVRVQADADVIPMTDMAPPADPGIDRRKGVRTRATDAAALEVDSDDAEDAAPWDAAALPLTL